MLVRTRRFAATAAALAVAATGAAAVADVPRSERELIDLAVRPESVSLAALPSGQGFAAVYDDRLSADVLRYAEKRGTGQWASSEIAGVIDGHRVGREPVLAVSRSGLRVVAFRTELQLDPGTAPAGQLYVARAS